MSRPYSQSPSPAADLYEPPPRGRRDDGRWVGRSRSGQRGGMNPVRGRGSAYVQPRSCSRSRSLDNGPTFKEAPRQRRRRNARHPDEEGLDPLDDRHGGAPRHREERRGAGERPRPSRRGELELSEAPRDKRGRHETGGRGGGRDRDMRKMQEAQQVQMRSMMGMMGMNPAAMQMAMMQQMQQMGMVHPQYMQAMQQQQMMMGRRAKKKTPGEGSSSGSGDSSSSDSSDAGPGGFNPAAMAAMAAMSQWPASASAGPPPQQAAYDFKPPPNTPGMPPPPPPPPPPPGMGGADSEKPAGSDSTAIAVPGAEGAMPARKSAKKEIETMINDYRLSPGCAWMMRALPPDKQKLAAKIDPSGQADPSGYVAEELKKIV